MVFEYLLKIVGFNSDIFNYFLFLKQKVGLCGEQSNDIIINNHLYNLYSGIILVILSLRPIYVFMNSSYDSITFISFFYYLLVPVQYYLGIKYFSKEHFNKTMEKTDCYNDSMKSKIVCLIIFITISCILCNTILVSKEKIYHISINIIINIYSWLSIVTNLCGFIFVFCYHTKQIKNLSNNINSKNWNNVESNNNISVIIYKLSVIRNEYNDSVLLLNNIFSSACILGGISTYTFIKLLIQGVKLNISIYLNIGLYCFIQLIFIFIIIMINNSIDSIKKIVHSPVFVKKYLSRKEKFYELEKIANEASDSYVLDYENASSIDWLILTSQLEKEWEDFTLLGFKVKDELFKRFFTLIGIFISINNFSLLN